MSTTVNAKITLEIDRKEFTCEIITNDKVKIHFEFDIYPQYQEFKLIKQTAEKYVLEKYDQKLDYTHIFSISKCCFSLSTIISTPFFQCSPHECGGISCKIYNGFYTLEHGPFTRFTDLSKEMPCLMVRHDAKIAALSIDEECFEWDHSNQRKFFAIDRSNVECIFRWDSKNGVLVKDC